MGNFTKAAFYGIGDYQSFVQATQSMVNQINTQNGIFIGDNLITRA